MARINVHELQSPIRQRYKDDPQAAQIKLRVRSAQADLRDPLHCAALPVFAPGTTWKSGAHPAVGPIGLTAIRSTTRVTVPDHVRGERAERLLRSAEKYCVVLNTLRNGVPVESAFSLQDA